MASTGVGQLEAEGVDATSVDVAPWEPKASESPKEQEEPEEEALEGREEEEVPEELESHHEREGQDRAVHVVLPVAH